MHNAERKKFVFDWNCCTLTKLNSGRAALESGGKLNTAGSYICSWRTQLRPRTQSLFPSLSSLHISYAHSLSPLSQPHTHPTASTTSTLPSLKGFSW